MRLAESDWVTTAIAVWGAITGSLSLGWSIFRDIRNAGRVKVVVGTSAHMEGGPYANRRPSRRYHQHWPSVDCHRLGPYLSRLVAHFHSDNRPGFKSAPSIGDQKHF